MSGPDSHSVTEVPAVAELERDPRAAPTLLVTLIGTILLLAVVLTAQLLFQSAEWIHETAPESPKNPELAKIQSEQLAAISQYRLLDRRRASSPCRSTTRCGYSQPTKGPARCLPG